MGMFDDLVPQKGAFDDLIPAKKIDSTPEELSFGEKAVSMLPDSVKNALGGFMDGNVRGSAMGRMAMGAADPGVALVQLGANAIGQGRPVNDVIKRAEERYQAARAAQGSTGFDPMRMAGNVAITAPLAGIGGVGETLAGTIGRGAASGAGFAALEPVTNGGDNFWTDKGTQALTGAVVGGVAQPIINAAGRVISPNASTNPQLKLLRDEGVQPTIGQTLGGAANWTEQKLQSVPILGDAIRGARGRALEQFNEAAVNRATEPIGVTIKGSGQKAIAEAGDALSREYDDALKSIAGVNFDTPQFNQRLGELKQMAENLTPEMNKKFNNVLDNIVLGRMSPNGSMLPEVFKKVDSEVGDIAARYSKSGSASESELGDALKQLKANLFDEVKASNPQVAARLDAADKGWANLVRLEKAGNSAINNEGVFTPAQLNSAVKNSDGRVRHRGAARGEALGQDLSSAGQSVLGNNYPDSGTAGRMMMGAGALATGAINPAIPAALVGGAAAYTPQVQNFLRVLTANRPDIAPQVRNYLRKIAPYATLTAGPVATENRK